MRVIAGKFKGRRLVSFDAAHLRPTTDRIKGSIFNKLAAEIEGARVLDLFSGTGSLAIEALSRGADEVTLVEKNPKSLRIIRQNLEALKVQAGAQIEGQDVFQFLKRYSGAAFHIILVDPPFTQELADEVLKALATSAAVATGTLVAIEAGRHEKLAETYEPLVLKDRRDYGDKSVSFFTCP